MILRATVLLSCLSCVAPAQVQNCRTIDAEHITVGDLVPAVPGFAAAPADRVVGYAPLPGFKRTFHTEDLLAIARRLHVPLGTASEICFSWEMHSLDRKAVLDAMRASLQAPEASLQLVDVSGYQVPNGRVEFLREHLQRPAQPGGPIPVLWRGDVIYGQARRFSIWATVRITVPCRRLVAAEPLKQGLTIEPGQVKQEMVKCFPDQSHAPLNLSDAVGQVLLRPVPSGEEILPSFLTGPYAVKGGDEVTVEVHSGLATLKFTAKAEGNGRKGDLISIRNPQSRKLFRARVEGNRKVVVVAGN